MKLYALQRSVGDNVDLMAICSDKDKAMLLADKYGCDDTWEDNED